MKITSKTFWFTAFILLINVVNTDAQICYNYDAAGNRIKRYECCTNCKPAPSSRDQTVVQSAEKLMVLPNPTAGVFKIEAPDIPSDAQVIILNMSGEVLSNRPIGDGQFDLSAFPAGSYIIHLMHGNIRKTAILEKSK